MSAAEKEPKKTPAKPKAKPVKRQAVKLIAHQGESALVEWFDDKYHRVYVPVAEFDFEKKTVAENVLAMGIPYGVDWSQMDVTIDPVELDQELKKRGIWTRKDLESKPNQAIAAINRISGMMRRQMLDVAEKGGNK